MLGQCASLVDLNLSSNQIGAKGAGRLAAVLPQYASLAHLNLDSNSIWDVGLGCLRRCYLDVHHLLI